MEINKFKIGDTVKRIDGEWNGMKVGEIDEVLDVRDDWWVTLKKYGKQHSVKSLELFDEEEEN